MVALKCLGYADDSPEMQYAHRHLDGLILEGLRLGATVHRMHTVIPSERAVFQMGPPPENPDTRYTVGPLEWRVLRVLDGLRDVLLETLAQ